MEIRPPVGLNNLLNNQGAGRYEDWKYGQEEPQKYSRTTMHLGEKLDEVEYLRHKQTELQNNRAIESLINYCTTCPDPLLHQNAEEINPYIPETIVKASNANKKVEKLLSKGGRDRKSVHPTTKVFLTLLVTGDKSQKNFWEGLGSKVPGEYRREGYLTWYLTEIKFQLQKIIYCSTLLNHSLSHDNTENWRKLQLVTPQQISQARKYVEHLWGDPSIRYGVEFLKKIHTNNIDHVTYLFQRASTILSDRFIPSDEDQRIQMKIQRRVKDVEYRESFICKINGVDKVHGSKKKIMGHFAERDILVFFADISTIDNIKQTLSKFKHVMKIIKPTMGVFIVVTGMKQLSKLKSDPIFQSYSSSEPFDKYIEGRFMAHSGQEGLKLFSIVNHSKTITDDVLKKVGNHMRDQFKDEALEIF